ncbi:hypothetical protein [uncultured Campylobacter sp.]|uniref:hypothetical protein n=1 Tax=uncultured Campylobacter sp. TaxID=218934 RepID=UPI0015BCEB31|nr:hypothetical protein [uncultured Campylobacter sp.]
MLDIGEGINEGLQNAISSVIVSKQIEKKVVQDLFLGLLVWQLQYLRLFQLLEIK